MSAAHNGFFSDTELKPEQLHQNDCNSATLIGEIIFLQFAVFVGRNIYTEVLVRIGFKKNNDEVP
jgi:hypothetical protein